MNTILERQNQVIIALLARNAIGVDAIEKIVTSGKKEGRAEDFVRAYNELDGSKTITEIANHVGVSKQNISQVLQTWEDKGIVFNVGTSSRPSYVGLLKLHVKSKTRMSSQRKKHSKKRKTLKKNGQTKELPVINQAEPSVQFPVGTQPK